MGLPGAGKTDWAQKFVASINDSYSRYTRRYGEQLYISRLIYFVIVGLKIMQSI